MGIEIQDPHVQNLVRQLAEQRGVSPEEAIRLACQLALTQASRDSLIDRLKPLQDHLATLRRPGVVVDKAFYDSLYED